MKKAFLTTLFLLSSCIESRHVIDVEQEHARIQQKYNLSVDLKQHGRIWRVNQAEQREQAFFDTLREFSGEDFDEPNVKLFFWSNYSYYSKLDPDRGMYTYSFLNRLDSDTPPKAIREYVHFWLLIQNPKLRNTTSEIIWRNYRAKVL